MKIKHRECREAETQLRMIEERLGMTPTQYNMPPSPATMLLTEINTSQVKSSQSLFKHGKIHQEFKKLKIT